MSDSTKPIVWGIDLGTTYSCIARLDEFERYVVEPNAAGEPTTPSVVFFQGPDEVVVGAEARGMCGLEPANVCELVKNYIGDPDWRFEARGREWSAVEVSARILRALADGAHTMTGLAVEQVVITVPAYFGISQREATIEAGKLAGLKVLDIVNEPTAAAIAYDFAHGGAADETVLVYDLGGGTFDVTVVRFATTADGGHAIEEVVIHGDDRLGGSLWDVELARLLADKFRAEHPEAPSPLDDAESEADLKVKAECVKRALTAMDSYNATVFAGGVAASVKVTREEFERATATLLERTIELTRRTVGDAEAAGAKIDRVLLVGGSSLMPAVRRRLVEVFPDWQPQLSEPHQAVAKGAAFAAFHRWLLDLIRASMQKTSGTPADRERIITETARDSGVSRATVERMLLTKLSNICPRGFGFKVVKEGRNGDADDDCYVDHLIEPATALPVDPPRQATYRTIADNSTGVNIVLMEQNDSSSSSDLAENRLVAEKVLALSGADPRGTPIHVSLGMHTNGTLMITARHEDGREISFEGQSRAG